MIILNKENILGNGFSNTVYQIPENACIPLKSYISLIFLFLCIFILLSLKNINSIINKLADCGENNDYIKKLKLQKSESTSYMIETISGFETVKGTHLEECIKDKFEKKLAKELKLTRVSAPLFVTTYASPATISILSSFSDKSEIMVPILPLHPCIIALTIIIFSFSYKNRLENPKILKPVMSHSIKVQSLSLLLQAFLHLHLPSRLMDDEVVQHSIPLNLMPFSLELDLLHRIMHRLTR